MTDVAAGLAEVRGRIESAARAAGRSADEITLVAVSKEVDAEAVGAAVAAGQLDFGENRAQELSAKAARLIGLLDARGAAVTWHFIGRLQRNKVKAIAPLVSLWHSIDHIEIGEEVARRAPAARVLVQVNVAGEDQKGGCAPSELGALVDGLTALGLSVEGLMTVPPMAGDPRPHFAAFRELATPLRLSTLSMGMSGDFEAAIAEGSTLVRVGRAVFGSRSSGLPA